MNRNVDNSIIIATATPYGRSAVAVIRISGNGCIEKVNRFLSHELRVGRLELNRFTAKEFSENLMAVCFKAPKSYTGEDTVELQAHGNMAVCDGIIKTLLDDGLRLAERGEFTKRAFLNGKVNLMQCEALADIIDAQTKEQLVYGNKRYNGGFKSLDETENLLNKALSTVEAVLHYSDELEENEIDESLLNDVYVSVDKIIALLKAEERKFFGGKIINDGFKVALIGEPNVGKSTILNAVTESERAIVTPIAGTTRDTVDGEYIYNDRKFVITDTAGITETSDVVEKIGVERAVKAANNADAVVFVTTKAQKTVESVVADKKITVLNKCDDEKDVGTDYVRAMDDGVLRISAKNGINITALKQMLYELCPKDFGGICNHRQYDCVRRCLDCCEQARIESKKQGGLEIVSALLYDAYTAIEELYGEKADEKVLDSVFERFCVGK